MAASRIEFGYLFFVLIPAVTALLIAAIVIVTVLLTVRANRRSSVSTPDVPKKPLSQLLRELRSSAGMTQEYVAEAVGVSRQAVSKWESGASDPTAANLTALAGLYHIPVEELMAAK